MESEVSSLGGIAHRDSLREWRFFVGSEVAIGGDRSSLGVGIFAVAFVQLANNSSIELTDKTYLIVGCFYWL